MHNAKRQIRRLFVVCGAMIMIIAAAVPVSAEIAVAGCSQTTDAVQGYVMVPGNESQFITPVPEMGGGGVNDWTEEGNQYEKILIDSLTPETDMLLWMPCIRAGYTSPDGVTDQVKAQGEQVARRLREIVGPSVEIVVTPINSWEPNNCAGAGPHGWSNSVELVDYLVAEFAAELGPLSRGPNIGPLTPDMLGVRDNCHPNDKGKLFLGEQLAEFFDGGVAEDVVADVQPPADERVEVSVNDEDNCRIRGTEDRDVVSPKSTEVRDGERSGRHSHTDSRELLDSDLSDEAATVLNQVCERIRGFLGLDRDLDEDRNRNGEDDTSSEVAPDPSVAGDDDLLISDPPAPITAPVTRVITNADQPELANGFTVPAGEHWAFDSSADVEIISTTSVVVEGVLSMNPACGSIHRLLFDTDGTALGSDNNPTLQTDIRLMVMGQGRLNAIGCEKAGWNRTGSDPTWEASDEIVVAPTSWGMSDRGIAPAYDLKPFTIGEAVPRLEMDVPEKPFSLPHPADLVAEVMNLTRNVQIGGYPGRNLCSIMFMNAETAQDIRYVEIDNVGIEGALGCYPIHFHQNGDATRGTRVEGVVSNHSGNHAFVAHASHGISFIDTVAVNYIGAAYWWDPVKGTGTLANATDDVLYQHTIACAGTANVGTGRNGEVRTQVNDFSYALMAGTGGRVIDSVACGGSGMSGFGWPPNDEQVYEFRGNVAHNMSDHGIWIWHNSSTPHLIEDFTAYTVGKSGVFNGAYNNCYSFDEMLLVNNTSGIHIEAGTSCGDNGQVWSDVELLDNLTPVVATNNASAPNWPVSLVCFSGQSVPEDNFRYTLTGC